MSSQGSVGFGRRTSSNNSGSQDHNDRSKKIILIASILFIASIVALVVIIFKKQKKEESSEINTIVKEEKSNIVFVLERPVYAGQRMADAIIREIPWPKVDIPEDAIKSRQDFTGKFAITDITTNVPIRGKFISEKIGQAKLKVSPGNRAVTIQVDATSGLEGLAQPGMRVDVVLTYSTEEGLKSIILVPNARILSVDGSTKEYTLSSNLDPRLVEQAMSGTSSVKTITLDVSPDYALKITTGVQMGKLTLLARSIDGVADDPSSSYEPIIVTQEQIDPKPAKPTPTSAASQKKCVKGIIKSGDKQFEVQCDGSMVEIGLYK